MIALLLTAMLTACDDGSSSGPGDPPWKPDLIHHIGDAGDVGQKSYIVNTPDGEITNTINVVNDHNNGIDAVSDGNWIKIQWVPFIDDIEYVRIYRFRKELTGIVDHVLLDSIRTVDDESYVDNSLNEVNIGQELFYYIEIVDEHRQFSISDTVSYKLVGKALLNSPENQVTINGSDVINFVWTRIPSGLVVKYRLLIFNENDEIVWSYDEYDIDPSEYDLEVLYNIPDDLETGTYYWRVDAFGNDILVNSGSESALNMFYYIKN